jgi:small basic protein
MLHEHMLFFYIFLMLAPLAAELVNKIKVDGVILKCRMLAIVIAATMAALGNPLGQDILIIVLAIRYFDKITYYLFFKRETHENH